MKEYDPLPTKEGDCGEMADTKNVCIFDISPSAQV